MDNSDLFGPNQNELDNAGQVLENQERQIEANEANEAREAQLRELDAEDGFPTI